MIKKMMFVDDETHSYGMKEYKLEKWSKKITKDQILEIKEKERSIIVFYWAE